MRGLGKMYSGGGEITTNIDDYGGKGTAIFVADAIEIYCDNAELNRNFIYEKSMTVIFCRTGKIQKIV